MSGIALLFYFQHIQVMNVVSVLTVLIVPQGHSQGDGANRKDNPWPGCKKVGQLKDKIQGIITLIYVATVEITAHSYV